MVEGWEIPEVTKQGGAEFDGKCDWCRKGVITHVVLGNNQRLSMVGDHCYRKKNVKEIEGAIALRKNPIDGCKVLRERREPS